MAEEDKARRKRRLIMFLFASIAGIAGALMSAIIVLSTRKVIDWSELTKTALSASIALGLTFLYAGVVRESRRQTHFLEARKEDSERAAAENPEKPELAWVAGRALLEKYLDRNLKQVRTIATLTYFVMLTGFGFILFGLLKAFNDPAKLPIAIVASASGVLVSFIGGSFLLVYRSLLVQTKDYLFVLERINSVGMSMAVIGSLPEEAAELRQNATAQLSKDLLTLYGGYSNN